MASGPIPSPTPLSSSIPTEVGPGPASAGTSPAASRSDHVHEHGDNLGGTLHSAATTLDAGFLSAADKTTLDDLPNIIINIGNLVGWTTTTNATPEPVGTAAVGSGSLAARDDHVHAHGDQLGGTLHAVATQSTAGFQSAADKTKQDNSVADWSLSLVRYYLLDYDGGNDTNIGYIDAAAGSTLAPAGLALKTMEKLYQVVPVNGSGRSIVILQKLRSGGANYLQQDAVTLSSIDTSRWTGYRTFLWRGSTDLTNDVSDRITCGFMVAVAGPGGSQEFTVAAGASTTLVPIAAGTIGVEAATQFRIRFLSTTTTVALRNICRCITSGVVDASVTCGSALPATPAAGDVFVIERPGVRVDQINFAGAALGATIPPSTASEAEIVGIGWTTIVTWGVLFNGGRLRISGLDGVNSSNSNFFVSWLNRADKFTCSGSYTDEVGNYQSIGMGFRTQCSWSFGGSSGQPCMSMNISCFGSMNVNNPQGAVAVGPGASIGGQSYFSGIMVVEGSSASGRTPQTSYLVGVDGIFGDPSTSNAQTRIIGGSSSATTQFACLGPVNLLRLKFENMTNAVHGSIWVKQTVGGTIVIDGCTNDGTGPIGIDLTGCWGTKVFLGLNIANTLTGTLGEIRFGDNVITTHASMLLTNVVDSNGNDVTGSLQRIVDQCYKFTNGDGTAHVVGEVVRVSATGTVVRAQANTPANAVGSLLVAVTPPLAAGLGLYVPMNAPMKWVLHDAAPTLADMSYLSTATGGLATSTVPVAGAGPLQRLRLGRVARVSGSLGLVTGSPELLSSDADGSA